MVFTNQQVSGLRMLHSSQGPTSHAPPVIQFVGEELINSHVDHAGHRRPGIGAPDDSDATRSSSVIGRRTTSHAGTKLWRILMCSSPESMILEWFNWSWKPKWSRTISRLTNAPRNNSRLSPCNFWKMKRSPLVVILCPSGRRTVLHKVKLFRGSQEPTKKHKLFCWLR